jgi:hypothetical protein
MSPGQGYQVSTDRAGVAGEDMAIDAHGQQATRPAQKNLTSDEEDERALLVPPLSLGKPRQIRAGFAATLVS